MTKNNAAFLLAGLAFGILIGAGAMNAVSNQPDLNQTSERVAAAAPSNSAPPAGGPPANAASGAAPMMAEIRGLRDRVKENPDDLKALVRLANVYHDVSMFDEAIDFYGQALAIDSGNPNLMTDLGICHRGKGEFDRALELFDEAFASDPNHWQSLFNRAVVTAFDLGRFDEAEQTLSQMEPLAPADRIQELRAAIEQARSGARPGSPS